MVQGYLGSGNSSVLLDIIARATNGLPFPDGKRLPASVSAVYQCTESGSQSITKRMLVHSGADLERVSYIDGAYLTISDSRIQRAIRETDA